MPEDGGRNEPPTYFANIATMNLNVDGMTIELRQYLPAHAKLFGKIGGGEVKAIPAPTEEDVYKVDPVARVVLTFTAVQAMKKYLDDALPQMEKARKT